MHGPGTNAVLIETLPRCQFAMREVLRQAGVSKVKCCEPGKMPPESFPRNDVNLVVASLSALESWGKVSIPKLRKYFANANIVITSEDGVERRRVFELLAEGVDGFLPRTMPIEQMADACRAVIAGGTFVPALEHDCQPSNPIDNALTPRQQQILALLKRGLTNKEIARELSISPGTVKVHLNTVYRAMGVHNRVAALAALEGDPDGLPNGARYNN